LASPTPQNSLFCPLLRGRGGAAGVELGAFADFANGLNFHT
jgi:hypothetical protein